MGLRASPHEAGTMASPWSRVALVLTRLRAGGKENCIVDLADALFDQGRHPIIVCLSSGGGLERKLRHPDIRVINLNKAPGNDLRIPLRLARILRREAIDIAHSNNWGTMLECLVAAPLAGIRTVIHTQHGLDYGWGASRTDARSLWRDLVKPFAARRFTRIAAVSEEVRVMITEEWGVPENRVALIQNGVNLRTTEMSATERERRRALLGFAPGDFVVGSVGLFRPVKDFPTLIEAFRIVRSQCAQAKLVLIGDGSERGDLEELVRRAGLGSSVQFLGLRTDVEELLPLLDLFALTSTSEGTSISILEAMGAGVPVVATRVGGTPGIISHGETGLLAPARSPTEIAAVILSVLERPAVGRALAHRALEVVHTRFTAERMAADYTRLYTDACLGIRRAAPAGPTSGPASKASHAG